ncbi:MAG: type VII toxin-antitoxin system MntA family adenylyltransferase antitoxin [Spirochaetia bacterium]
MNNKIVRVLEKRNDVNTVILYGSYAKGFPDSESDVDIAIGGSDEYSTEQLYEIYSLLTQELGNEVDLRDMRKIAGMFLSQVLQKGVILINKDPVFLHRKLEEMMDYRQDMLPIIQKSIENNIQEFINGR